MRLMRTAAVGYALRSESQQTNLRTRIGAYTLQQNAGEPLPHAVLLPANELRWKDPAASNATGPGSVVPYI